MTGVAPFVSILRDQVRHGFPANETAVYACGNSDTIRNVRAVAGRQRMTFHAEAFD